jgi:hypothetical protein
MGENSKLEWLIDVNSVDTRIELIVTYLNLVKRDCILGAESMNSMEGGKFLKNVHYLQN